MDLPDFAAAITHFLDHVVQTSASGSADATLRARALATGQKQVDLYWEQPQKMREASDTLSFDATGVSDLPVDFASWDRNFGWIVFASPRRIKLNPTLDEPSEVMSRRVMYPDRAGSVLNVVMHQGKLYRWPTKPSVAPEAAVAFYHRISPQLIDSTVAAEQADWLLIPTGDRLVIVEDLMLSSWDTKSGDAREGQHLAYAQKRLRQLFQSRNLSQQPSKLGKPFRARPSYGRPIVGDRWNR